MANKFLSTAPKIIAQIESPKLAVLITTKEVLRRLAVEDEDHVINLSLI
jgi:superfamily II DNA/RNA helicase